MGKYSNIKPDADGKAKKFFYVVSVQAFSKPLEMFLQK